METANLEQIEFLKGPSSIMTGLDAIGGSVNFVSRQPTSGAIKSELDGSIDSLGTYRTHFGSGGSTTLPGLDYRFDVSSSKDNSFIDGDYQQLNNVSGQLNYRVNDAFKVFGAFDYKQDDGHAYWGTPLTTTAFSGPFSTSGVVAGSAVNTFTGALLSPVTIDSRTTTTNYNIADNSTGAKELWLRGGFDGRSTATSRSRTTTTTARSGTGPTVKPTPLTPTSRPSTATASSSITINRSWATTSILAGIVVLRHGKSFCDPVTDEPK